MRNNGAAQRFKERLLLRWSSEDYPGGRPQFQLGLLAKDIAVFCLIPVGAIIIFKILEAGISNPGTNATERRRTTLQIGQNEKHTQIIQFQRGTLAKSRLLRRAPGTLVRVRTLNTIETYTNAPVHAQIIDSGLGKEFLGGTLIGDAIPDLGSGRITIDFRFARYARRSDIALPIAARAMSLDGTFGIEAKKKEGFFARAAIRSASSNPNSIDTGTEKQDLRTLVARAVAAGMMQEFQSDASVAHNKAQVLVLKPMTEFLVELTDYFPGQM